MAIEILKVKKIESTGDLNVDYTKDGVQFSDCFPQGDTARLEELLGVEHATIINQEYWNEQ